MLDPLSNPSVLHECKASCKLCWEKFTALKKKKTGSISLFLKKLVLPLRCNEFK